jgi:Holliday junction resolvasome RuvABC DNA-binding subunit
MSLNKKLDGVKNRLELKRIELEQNKASKASLKAQKAENELLEKLGFKLDSIKSAIDRLNNQNGRS